MDEFKKLLSEYVSIRSISTDPDMQDGVDSTANWLKNLFETNGFKSEILTHKGINPVVFASYNVSEDAKTVLIYGHYDVQPAEVEEGWVSEPFVLTERDNRLYARGVMDNKGQNLIHIYTVIKLIKDRNLKYNVKFLIEGNEESGGVEELAQLMQEKKDLFTTDYVLISDGELVSGMPAIEASFRGGFSATINYKVANNNVHSGLFGGAVPNAGYEMSKLLSKVYSDTNVVSFSSFYKDVDEISKDMVANNRKLADIAQKGLLESTGFKKLKTENDMYDLFTQTGLRPTMQVTGIKCGYIGNGYSNIVPATAQAKINFRTVTSQVTDDVVNAFKNFVKENTPDYVDYEIEVDSVHDPVKLDISKEIFKEVREILKDVYEVDPIVHYVGGAIPVIATFKSLFGIDAVSVGLGNEDCNMHGANENFSIDCIVKGLEFSSRFFRGV